MSKSLRYAILVLVSTASGALSIYSAYSAGLENRNELMARGYLGDGSGKTLGSRFRTIEEARVTYPHAIALTDTFDWAALQGLILAHEHDNGIRIDIPAGVGVFNEPVVSGATTVEIVGSGRGTTRLIATRAGTDLFQHGLARVVYNSRFILRHLGLYVTGTGVRYAINIRQDTNSGGFVLEDVFIGSYSAKYSWLGFVMASGTSNTNWKDVVMTGGEYNPPSQQKDMTEVGVTFFSVNNNDRSVVYNMDNVQVGAVHNAFKFIVGGDTPQNHGSIEGVQFSRSGGRTDTGPWFFLSSPHAAVTGWFPPYYTFMNCNMEGPGTLITADAISEFHISDNLQYIDPAQPGVQPTSFIDIKRGLHGTITNNTFAALPGARFKYFIHIGNISDAIRIYDNVFSVQAKNVSLSGGIDNEAGNYNIHANDNIFEGPFGVSFAAPGPWPSAIPQVVNRSIARDGNSLER